MENKEPEVIELTTAAAIGVGSALLGAGSAWGANRKAIKDLEGDVEELRTNERNVIDRLARIETKLDLALQRSN